MTTTFFGTYQITETDYVNAIKLHLQLRRKTRIIAFLAILLLLILAALLPYYRSLLLIIVGEIIIMYALFRFVYHPWRAKQTYRKHRDLFSTVNKLTIEDKGLRILNEDSESIVRWHKLYQWRQNTDYIMLYHTTKIFRLFQREPQFLRNS